MTKNAASPVSILTEKTNLLYLWLHQAALPLWWEVGASKGNGGFYERIGQDGVAMYKDNRRSRVQPRQIYCYATAAKLEWDGPWREIIKLADSWYDRTFLLENGLYGNLCDANEKLIDPVVDIYNQAFFLLSSASIAKACPDTADRQEVRALRVLHALRKHFAHAMAGFQEALPPRVPLRSNPHMHIFEAALAWERIETAGPQWRELADEIGQLALSHFIDQETGVLREFFDLAWKPLPGTQGRLVEPGHLFEWAWLLTRWGEQRDSASAFSAARRLFEIAETFGICRIRQVAVMGLYDDFTIENSVARLWPQTEWLKASLRLAMNSSSFERERYLESAIKAYSALTSFLNTSKRGLWFDRWPENEDFVDEPAPASTFYHIVSAIEELKEAQKYGF